MDEFYFCLFFFFWLDLLAFCTELARDCLNHSGKYVVERGIISIVHDDYGKKVCVYMNTYTVNTYMYLYMYVTKVYLITRVLYQVSTD